MATCAKCGTAKATERPCPRCGRYDNAKVGDYLVDYTPVELPPDPPEVTELFSKSKPSR